MRISTSPNKVLERNALSHTTEQFQFHGRNYLQNHGTEMGTKVAVAFANIFMVKIEKKTEDRVLLNRWWGKDTLTMSSPRGTQLETKSKALFERINLPNAQDKSQVVEKVVMTVGRSHSGHHIISCFTFKWKFFAFFSFTFYNKTFLYTNFTVSKIYLMHNFFKVPIFFVNRRALSSEH